MKDVIKCFELGKLEKFLLGRKIVAANIVDGDLELDNGALITPLPVVGTVYESKDAVLNFGDLSEIMDEVITKVRFSVETEEDAERYEVFLTANNIEADDVEVKWFDAFCPKNKQTFNYGFFITVDNLK